MELLALKHGLHLAIDHNLIPLDICVDSLQVINMLNNENLLYNSIILECRSLLEKMGNPPVHHIYRKQNRVADSLAKLGSNKGLFERMHIFATPPPSIGLTFWEDYKGKTLSRLVPSSVNFDHTSHVFVPD
ncbi:hypothetical protein FXO37_30154 [Capsicum annuum]|nr:hypothetical protein FXO37_30154 [Capsicum annuum]